MSHNVLFAILDTILLFKINEFNNVFKSNMQPVGSVWKMHRYTKILQVMSHFLQVIKTYYKYFWVFEFKKKNKTNNNLLKLLKTVFRKY